MKRVLLSSFVFLFSAIAVFAYETIIIKYPSGENWVKAYYKKVGNEAILQYVPKGQSAENWTRSIIVHSYNESNLPVNIFMGNDLARMKKTNPTANYKYLKNNPVDMIAGRCTEDYKGVKAQCEFYRVTRMHNGIVSIHYINRDKNDFLSNYTVWYDIVKKAKFYNSYYRDERIMDKSEYFEL